MTRGTTLARREQGMVLDLTDALGASLDLHAVLKDAYSVLLPLVDADYGALATSPSPRAEDYEWIVQDLPASFLGSYEEMAPHDFVRRAVLENVNVVLRDPEMIDRRGLEQNMMYHRAREVGSPLEQVMAVMLHSTSGFQSGLSLYRARKRPFSEREQRLLQRLTLPIGNAVRNCRLFARAERLGRVLEVLLGSDGGAVIVVQAPDREIERTGPSTALVDRWFSPVERGPGGLPLAVLRWVGEAEVARARGSEQPWTHRIPSRGEATAPGASLKVELLPLPEATGKSLWAVRLQEVPEGMPMPAAWRERLTPRECDVVAGVLRGWLPETIAHELGNISRLTVKTHLQRIFQKLAVESREALLHKAWREQ